MDIDDNLQNLGATVVGKKFSSRAIAYIIDVIILNITNYAVSSIIGIILGIFFILINKQVPSNPQYPKILDYLSGIFSTITYFVIFEALYGASLGKLFLGMRVTMQDGNPCSFKAAMIRGLYRFIDGLFFAIPAYVKMKSPLYQRIGDHAAHTIVINAKDEFIKEQSAWWWLLIAGGIFLLVQALLSFFLLLYIYR